MDRLLTAFFPIRDRVLLVRPGDVSSTESWLLPHELVKHGQPEEEAIHHTLRDDLGFECAVPRYLYESEPDRAGVVTCCYLFESYVSDQQRSLEEAADPNQLLKCASTERAYWWAPLEQATSIPGVARAMKLLKCPVIKRWPSETPFNWVRVEDKKRELAHRIRRAERYFALPEKTSPGADPLYQSLFKIEEHITSSPVTVWEFVRRAAIHPAKHVRVAIAVCLMEELLRKAFAFTFPKVAYHCRINPRFASTFLFCYAVGQAGYPLNKKKCADLKKQIRLRQGNPIRRLTTS